MARQLRILGMGKYLPEKIVTSEELDLKYGFETGSVFKKSGIEKRHYITDETCSQMAAWAGKKALNRAGIEAGELDLILFASAVGEQPIPCTATLVQKELGLQDSGIPSFDINSTCTSFVTALDLASYYVDAGAYEKILICSSETASQGINPKHLESTCLFGDGAAAAVVGSNLSGENSQVVAALMRTYSSGSETCYIKGGLSGLPAQKYTPEIDDKYRFYMDGGALIRQVLETMPGLMKDLLEPQKITYSDFAYVVPHQASIMGLKILSKRLKIPKEKFVINMDNGGNIVSAGLPMALHDLITEDKLQRGDLVLLMGMAAGLTLNGLILRY